MASLLVASQCALLCNQCHGQVQKGKREKGTRRSIDDHQITAVKTPTGMMVPVIIMTCLHAADHHTIGVGSLALATIQLLNTGCLAQGTVVLACVAKLMMMSTTKKLNFQGFQVITGPQLMHPAVMNR